jgi:hypothetical protein
MFLLPREAPVPARLVPAFRAFIPTYLHQGFT